MPRADGGDGRGEGGLQHRVAVAALVPGGRSGCGAVPSAGPYGQVLLPDPGPRAATGVFTTAQTVRDWIEARFGVVYTRDSVYTLLPRLGIRFKVPRPRHTKAAPQAQAT